LLRADDHRDVFEIRMIRHDPQSLDDQRMSEIDGHGISTPTR
jgi:hypothetical protein